MKFEGLVKVDYYDGKYLEQLQIKIEKAYLSCWTSEDTEACVQH